MGVFDALPVDDGGMSAAELAKKLEVDEILLGLWHAKSSRVCGLTKQSSPDARCCPYIF